MIERLAILAIIGALLVAASARAEVHRWIGADGVINYSDRAPQPEPAVAEPPSRPPVAAAVEPAAVAAVEPPVVAPTPAAPALQAEPAPTGPITLDALFELTGTRRQLAGLTARLSREFRPAKGQVAAPAEATIERVVARTFHADAIFRTAREEFARGLDQPKLAAKLAWLRSPLGRKIAALEIASGEPDHERLAAAFAAKPAGPPPSPRRRELVERLDWVSGASDVSADIVVALSSSVSRTVALNMQTGQRPSRRQIESQAEEMRTGVVTAVRQAAIVSMLYTYRALSDEELERYVEFESTEAGRWYNARLRQALLTALTRAFDDTAHAIFRAVPPERWSRAAAASPPAR